MVKTSLRFRLPTVASTLDLLSYFIELLALLCSTKRNRLCICDVGKVFRSSVTLIVYETSRLIQGINQPTGVSRLAQCHLL